MNERMHPWRFTDWRLESLQEPHIESSKRLYEAMSHVFNSQVFKEVYPNPELTLTCFINSTVYAGEEDFALIDGIYQATHVTARATRYQHQISRGGATLEFYNDQNRKSFFDELASFDPGVTKLIDNLCGNKLVVIADNLLHPDNFETLFRVASHELHHFNSSIGEARPTAQNIADGWPRYEMHTSGMMTYFTDGDKKIVQQTGYQTDDAYAQLHEDVAIAQFGELELSDMIDHRRALCGNEVDGVDGIEVALYEKYKSGLGRAIHLAQMGQ